MAGCPADQVPQELPMRPLTLAALRHRASPRTRAAADQRLLDVALTVSRQGIRPAPVRRG